MSSSIFPVPLSGIQETILDAKGDLIVASAADKPARLGVGANGTVLTADSAETTGVKWAASGASFVGCILTNSTTTTINNSVDTAISWNTETADTDAFHSTSTNPSRITIPAGKAGKYVFYLLAAGDTYHSSPAGQTQVNLRKNGTQIQSRAEKNETNFNTNIAYSFVVDAAVNDYYEMYIFQNTGINRTFYTDSAQFAAQYLGA